MLTLTIVAALPGCADVPRGHGRLEVADVQLGEDRFAYAYAGFTHRPPRPEPAERTDCTHDEIGTCIVTRCPAEDRTFFDLGPSFTDPPRQSAGDVSISVDGEVVLLDEDGTYWADLPAGFDAGQQVTLAATGAAVPAFAVTFVAPGIPALTLPTAYTRGRNLMLTWEPPPTHTALTVRVTGVFRLGGSSFSALTCTPDPASGSLIIEAAALDLLEIDREELTVTASYSATRVLRVGALDVRVDVSQQIAWLRVPVL